MATAFTRRKIFFANHEQIDVGVGTSVTARMGAK
jgi:hypothetical protein